MVIVHYLRVPRIIEDFIHMITFGHIIHEPITIVVMTNIVMI